MKATRHNGRSGKHGTYDAKHNERRFDVENSEHIDAERTKFNVYWDCYQGYSLPNDENKRAKANKTAYSGGGCLTCLLFMIGIPFLFIMGCLWVSV